MAGSSERVGMPSAGQTEQDHVYLLIDSKFPLADYYRLEEAYESGNKEEVNFIASRCWLVSAFAKDINSKYLLHRLR